MFPEGNPAMFRTATDVIHPLLPSGILLFPSGDFHFLLRTSHFPQENGSFLQKFFVPLRNFFNLLQGPSGKKLPSEVFGGPEGKTTVVEKRTSSFRNNSRYFYEK